MNDRLRPMTTSTGSAALAEQILPLPKVSLHDHLDGGLRPATLIELAAEIGHELPSNDPEELAEIFRSNANSGSLERYLEAFGHTTAVMQTAENLRRVAREYVEDVAADGVVYSEVRWAPEQHLGRGLTMDQAVEAVQAGLQEGVDAVSAKDSVIVVGQLISAMRQADNSEAAVDVALRYREDGVVGFDIAGPENGFPASKFSPAFTRLAENMLPATVHAGEGDGVESVRDALVSGRASRLGHGVRTAEDIEILESEENDGEEIFSVALGDVARWVRDRQVHLEVSPTSNVQTGAIAAFGDSLAQHPFDMLYQLGFNVGVNTDNRLVSGVTLTGELVALAETFGYGLAELADFQINALEASFIGYEERQALSEMILAAWNA